MTNFVNCESSPSMVRDRSMHNVDSKEVNHEMNSMSRRGLAMKMLYPWLDINHLEIG